MLNYKYKIFLAGMAVISALALSAQAQIPVGQNVLPPVRVPSSASAAPSVPPVLPGETKDVRVAPQLFLQHINNARLALKNEDADLARGHLQAAAALVQALKSSTAKPYYFPLSGAPATLSSQPDSMGRVNAGEKVYLNLDLNGTKTEDDIRQAETLVSASKYEEAEAILENLINTAIIQIPASAPVK